MSVPPEQLEAFAPLKWALPLFDDSNWCVRQRTRGAANGETTDIYCRETVSSFSGMEHWVELYQKPTPGTNLVTNTVSLCKYGPGLTGFPTICHGGAIMTMMDEALAFCMVANEAASIGKDTDDWVDMGGGAWREMVFEGKPVEQALKGWLVTAHMDLKFLKPVLCPGVVGVEVELLENKGHKMKIRGIMKDGNGTPLMQADGLWVRLGGGSKL